jgi:hypothetical protein
MAIWRRISATPGGQRYFIKDDDFKAPELREVYVCDNSGSDPDCTDDGPLCIDLEQPFVIGGETTFSMKVRKAREGGERYTVLDDLEGLFSLLDALRQPTALGERALRIKCVLGDKARVGARAILRCMAMGVNP